MALCIINRRILYILKRQISSILVNIILLWSSNLKIIQRFAVTFVFFKGLWLQKPTKVTHFAWIGLDLISAPNNWHLLEEPFTSYDTNIFQGNAAKIVGPNSFLNTQFQNQSKACTHSCRTQVYSSLEVRKLSSDATKLIWWSFKIFICSSYFIFAPFKILKIVVIWYLSGNKRKG